MKTMKEVWNIEEEIAQLKSLKEDSNHHSLSTHRLPLKLASLLGAVSAFCFLFSRFLILTLLASGICHLSSDLYASDMKAQLNGTAISNQFQILDNTGKVVGFIDAQGNAVFTGSGTFKGAGIITSALTSTGAVVLGTTTISNSSFTISGGSGDAIVIRNGGDLKIFSQDNGGSAVMFVDRNSEIGIANNLTVLGTATVSGNPGLRVSSSVYLGASQTDRYISDDSNMGVTRFSSSVFIAGQLFGGRIVVSSSAKSTAWVNSADNTSDTDVEDMSITINVPVAPAMIFAYCNVSNNGGGSDGTKILITHNLLIDGTSVSESSVHSDTSTDDTKRRTASMFGAARVSAAGSYIVKAQYRVSGGTGYWTGPRNITAFAIATP